MNERNDDTSGALGTIGFVLFFVGIYMFLFNLVRAKATSGFTVFFAGLTVFLIELLGALTIVVVYSDTYCRRAPLLYWAFGLSCFFYIVLLIKAFHEDSQYY